MSVIGQSQSLTRVPTLNDIRDAARLISGFVRHPQLLSDRQLASQTGARDVVIKPESLNVGGSFKIRGVWSKVLRMRQPDLERGLITFSTGNHARALCLAASEVGSSVVVYMPRDANPAKVDAVRRLGGEIRTYDRETEDRDELAQAAAEMEGKTFVHPYDDWDVIAGQGTVGLEVLDEAPLVRVIVVPAGGGGLASGIGIAAKAISPSCRIVLVEPSTGNDIQQSLEAGHVVTIPAPTTIADGISSRRPGTLTFPILQHVVDDVVTVSDAEIARALQYALRELKLVIEPAAAAALATVMAGKVKLEEQSVALILSGGNVHPAVLLSSAGSA